MSDSAWAPEPSAPPTSPPDFLATAVRERDRAEREEAAARAAFEDRVAGPARQLRVEWDGAWSALSDLLVPVWLAICREPSPGAIPDPSSLAAALARVGAALARFDPICDARLERNPKLHDLLLRERGIPNRPTDRLIRVRDDERFQSPAPRAAAELLVRAVSDNTDDLTHRVGALLSDGLLRVAFGWLPFLRDCVWPPPPRRRPGHKQLLHDCEDPIGAGPDCDDLRERIWVDDYCRAKTLLAGEFSIVNCDLFPEWAAIWGNLGGTDERSSSESPDPTVTGANNVSSRNAVTPPDGTERSEAGTPSSGRSKSGRSKSGRSKSGRSKGVTLAEAEIRVRDWLAAYAKDDPASITRDAVAAGAGISTGLVSQTAAWRAFRDRRDAGKKPKVRERPLTRAMRSVLSADERAALIDDLTAEQKADKAG